MSRSLEDDARRPPIELKHRAGFCSFMQAFSARPLMQGASGEVEQQTALYIDAGLVACVCHIPQEGGQKTRRVIRTRIEAQGGTGLLQKTES